MKKEKWFFNLLNKDVPEKEWEANYLIQDEKIVANYFISLISLVLAVLIASGLLIILTATIQCSVSMEFEGKGNIVLNEAELPSALEKFEFREGKVKMDGTIPCGFLTQFEKYGGN